MQRIASQIVWRINLLVLSLLPSVALAGESTPENFVDSKPLMLEVRYCECQATKTDSVPADLLPNFLKDSGQLKIAVSSEDKGFASSSELSIGFELKPVAGSPGQFQFNYAGTYTTSNGRNAGNAELLLVQGQWVILFGSRHDNGSGPQYSNVAVRLVLAKE